MNKRNKPRRAPILVLLLLVSLCCICSLRGGAPNTLVPTATPTPKNNPKDTDTPTPTGVNWRSSDDDEVVGAAL